MTTNAQIYRFGPFRFDPARRDLTREDTPLPAGGRALAILAGLIERPGALVTKDELLAKVWPGLAVEESNLAVQMRYLRQLLDDSERPHRWIATVPGRGYRFIGQIERGPPAAPPPHAALIGRDAELAALHATCARHRLVTLTGAGGIGKTRLALAFAEEFTADTGNAMIFLALETVRQPGQVAARLAARLGLIGVAAAELPASIAAALRSRPHFLVFDNCEHVLAEAAALIATILGAAPGAGILATSRERLGLAEEAVFALAPLEVPSALAITSAVAIADFPAIRLFAREAPGFALNDGNAADAAQICRRLDGIPLAIKLAAPLLASMSPAALNAGLAAALRPAAGPSTSLPARQRTVEATIAWSVALLAEAERALLLHLGVFAGSFSAAAVLAIAPEALGPGILQALVDKSLVAAEPPRFNVTRYRLLESTRAFARRRLPQAEMAAARLRLLRHLRRFYEESNIDYKTMSTVLWLGRYAPDLDNVREILDWALHEGAGHEEAVQDAQYLVSEVENLVYETPYGGDWHGILERCHKLLDASAPRDLKMRFQVFKYAGTMASSARNTELAREVVAWRRRPGYEAGLGSALVSLGMALIDPADMAPAFACLAEAEAILRAQNHQRFLATCLGTQAFCHGMAGDIANAERLTREALGVAERIGCRRVSTEARNYLVSLIYEAGRVEEAIAQARVQLERCRDAVQPVSELYVSFRLMAYLLHNNQRDAAFELLPGVLSCYTGPHAYMIQVARHAGLLAAELGRLETAARLAGYANAYEHELGLFADEALDKVSRERTAALLAGTPPVETAKWDETAVLELLRGLCA